MKETKKISCIFFPPVITIKLIESEDNINCKLLQMDIADSYFDLSKQLSTKEE
jgi:hypothetical protein